MIRAGIFIGVDRTGDLQQLTDAAAGAKRMYEWAISQGMTDPPHAKLITDANGGSVDPGAIFKAIKALVDGSGADQLIIYYAGHGVNIARNEYWLLSDAPVNTGAAVNVSGSVELARYCGGLQHIVVFSDACRVAAEGVQAQSVKGMEIFPNTAATDITRPVDQFYACALGRTAAEIADPKAAAKSFKAIYTDALLDALQGKVNSVLEAAPAGDVQYVRPRKLKAFLSAEVPTRVLDMGLEARVNQNPDAIITSDETWLARIAIAAAAARAPAAPPPGPARGGAPPPPPPPSAVPPSGGGSRSAAASLGSTAPRRIPRMTGRHDPVLTDRTTATSTISLDLVRAATQGGTALTDRLKQFRASGAGTVQDMGASVQLIQTPFGPDHFETQCGIKLRGARIVDFFAPRATAEILGNGELLRITGLKDNAPASVLVVMDAGSGIVGAVIPALPEFLAALTVAEGELMDVAYEPSANSWRADMYKAKAAEVRGLRAVAASASLHGRFHLDHSEAAAVGQQMQVAKGVDPTLAVYAGYAFHDLGEVKRIREMSGFLRNDVGATFFDLELLGRQLVDRPTDIASRIVPFTPLLSQGWAMLRAGRVKLHPALDRMHRTMQDSLWSLYDADGLANIRAAMASGAVR